MMNVKNAEMINKVIDPDLEKRDILESEIPRDVLDILLKDRTTGENIKWMTDSYEHLESTFDIKMGIHDSIDADTISRPGNKIIRPRVDKSKEEQRERVQKKAEVFTPSWICNNMNNLIDAVWFERKTSPFTVEGHKSWRATRKPIVFPKKLKKTWLDFVTEVRLEITCGEAPFLVSRYDTTTGEIIPIPERIGILDRKLRIVTENVRGKPKEWLKYAKMALKAVLGFEWQGDNVLLARENVLWTILEYYKYYCSSKPISHDDLLELADIVSWNIWQMDGLKFVVPMSCHDEIIAPKTPKPVQRDFFAVEEKRLMEQTLSLKKPCPGCAKKHILDGAEFHNGIYSKIMDWGTGEPHEFVWHYLHRDRISVEKEKRELQ
jgi:hypothetical protein